MNVEDEVRKLKIEVEFLDRQMSWMLWSRIVGLAIVLPLAGFLVASYPG